MISTASFGLKIESRQLDRGLAVLELRGCVDEYSHPQLSRSLSEAITAGHRVVALDGTGLEELTEEGVGALLAAYRQAQGTPVLCLLGFHGQPREKLEQLRFTQVLPHYETLSELSRWLSFWPEETR